MRKFKSALAIFLAVLLTITGCFSLNVAAATEDSAEIISADMLLDSEVNNTDEYFSNSEWAAEYPDGLYVVEYNSYEITEGGPDPENPEDIYLGIVVYRIGGNNHSSTLTYELVTVSGDEKMYPDCMGTLDFAPQQVTATAKIKIPNDDKRNGNQLLMLSLTKATSGAISDASTTMIKVFDDEPYVESVLTMIAEKAVADKNAGGIEVTVKRTENDTDYCTVLLKTSDGTAKAGVDYEAFEKEIVFASGVTEQKVRIPFVQSEEKFTEPKYFNLTMENIRGGVAEYSDSIRLGVTNELDKNKGTFIDVSDAKADMLLDESTSVAGGMQSVLNENDTLNRKDMLKAAVGAANGKAVSILAHTGAQPLLSSTGSTDYWSNTLSIPSSEFTVLYNTGDNWSYGSEYTDDDEDLLVATAGTYNLNLFEAIVYSCKSRDKSGTAFTGNPNTSLGYLYSKDHSYSDGNLGPAPEGYDLSSNHESSNKWMKDNDIYILKNHLQYNLDTTETPVAYSLSDSSGNRYPKTTGFEGSAMRPFYFVYNVKGQDDNHFKISGTQLVRSVIPFSAFADNENFAILSDNSGFTFTKNNYKWTFKVDNISKNGGVGFGGKDKTEYGFYAGSLLRVEFEPAVAGVSVPVPTVLHLKDSKGNVHNFSKEADGSFLVTLETNISSELSDMRNEYLLTEDEVNAHNALLAEGGCINALFNDKLTIDCEYAIQQGVEISYRGIPHVYESLNNMSDDAKKESILESLSGIVKFYKDGAEVYIEPTVNLDKMVLEYDIVEFDYLVTDPQIAGSDVKITSNLYSAEYQIITEETTIQRFVCAQISTVVTFTLSYYDSDYVDPDINLASTYVSHKVNGKFETTYIADYIDDNVPFEALFTDRTQAPEVVYYSMNFVVSDVYVGAYTEEMAVKDYPVTVYAGDIDSRNGQKLLSFTYHGGAAFSQASDLSLDIEEGIFDSGYMPVVELVSHSSNGYEYRMHIPVYYNYQNPNDVTYPAILKGGQGITIEVGDYLNGDDESHHEIVTSLNAKDTQYVCQKLIDVEGAAPQQSADGLYFEQQEDFYTYTDHVINGNTSPVTLDLTSLGTFISKIYALKGNDRASDKAYMFTGNGVNITFLDNQMSIGVRLGANSKNLVPPKKQPDLGIEMVEMTDNQLSAENIMGFEMPVVDPVTSNKSIKGAASTVNAAYDYFSVNLFFEAQVDLAYNSVRNQWDFSAFNAGVTGGFSFAKGVPIPALANLVYASFSIAGSLGLSSGFSAIYDYVDLDGNVNYAFCWNGITLSPSLAVSIGAGVGLCGVLAFEAGGSAEFSAAITFGAQEVTPKMADFDLDTNAGKEDDVLRDTYSGNWKTCLVANTTDNGYDEDYLNGYFYNNTYVISESEGDTVVIEGEGTAIQLTGVTKPDGGEINVTVYVDGNSEPVQPTQTLSLYSEHNEPHSTLFEWKMADFDNPDKAKPVKIKMVVENAGGKVILDSAKLYREDNRKVTTTAVSFDAAAVRLAFYVRVTVAFISLNLEPGYMLIKYNTNTDGDYTATVTLGTVYYSKTWDVSNVRTASKPTEDLPLVVVGDSGIRSTEEINYFDTGEFGSEKRKTLVQGDVMKSSKTQVLNYNGKTLAFFTGFSTDPETAQSRYSLYCNVPSYGNVLVSDDVYVCDFKAYIDNNSKLCVEITASDSSVKSMVVTGENSALLNLSDGEKVYVSDSSALSDVLKRTCVKVSTYNDDGTFTSRTLKGTDGNLRQESLPSVAVTDKNTVAFFVEDEAEYNSDFELDWKGFEGASDVAVNTENLMKSMFTGQGVIRYAVGEGSSFAEDMAISVRESFESRFSSDILSGIRITEMASSASEDGTVSLVYAVELPGVTYNTHKGTLKEIHYRKGVFDSDGKLTFSNALVVDSVIDYDEKLEDVLSPEEYTSKYYNQASGEVYENPVLRNLQMEKASLHASESSENEEPEPCIFYQTNSGINCVSYKNLSEALEAKNSGSEVKAKVNVLYSGYFNDYIIAVSETGDISLVYIDNADTSAYTDTLNIIDYDGDNGVWNHSRQLTYSDIFDPDALSDRRETYGMAIDNLSAFIDGRGDVAVAFKSDYAPFTYDYGVPYENLVGDNAPVDVNNEIDGTYVNNNNEVIEYMVTPMLDFSSEEARSDIYMITFKDRVTAVDVSNFNMLNKLFIPGETVSLSFDVANTGDTILRQLNMTLYTCDLDKRIVNPLATKVLSGVSADKLQEEAGENTTAIENGLLAGDSIQQRFDVKINEIQGNNTLLCLKITDENDNVIFDSYESYYANTNDDETDDKEVSYHLINNSPELIFNGVDVDVDAQGKMTFRTDIANIGTADMKEPATVYFKAYTEDENGNLRAKTLFSFTQYPIGAGSSDLYFDSYMVDEYIRNGELKYSFDIVTDEAQFDKSNDSTGVITNYQNPEISVDNTVVSTVLRQTPDTLSAYGGVRLSLGDVMTVESDVNAEHYDDVHLRAYEVGSDCLSIDNSSSDGRIRVKAVDMPENGRVKLLLNIKGTTVYKLFYVYITDRDVVNFNSEIESTGFEVSDKVHLYAKGADLFTTEENQSSLTFDFYGDDLSIYGNRQLKGGSFRLSVTDSKGKNVIDETISTSSEVKDYGMLLFKSEKLELDNYTVNIEAILKEGETLALDHARYTIDTADADVTPYASVGEAQEYLDAPLVNGRVRKARFNLVFSNPVKLAEGVDFKDISLLFDEYELVDGEYVATGDSVKFTAEGIHERNTLVLTSELSSEQGRILKYVLKDSHITENAIVTLKGTAVNTAIPDYDKVSYVLKESGILSVTVAEDAEMPDGSVHKSVNVKFMTTPEINRLRGTKLLYNTLNSKGEAETIEFKFVKMGRDPRVALYRADSLELSKDEMSKLFSFESGIVLNDQSYVLVTAQGDYLDNNISQVITDKTQLDIVYNKLKAYESQLSVITDITENGFESTFALYADFEESVDISKLGENGRAFVTMNAEFTDNATGEKETAEYILYADSLSEDGKTLCFKADESFIPEKGKTLNCTLKENIISYTDENAFIASAYDGIEVNPQLINVRNLSFNTNACIISATPYFEGGSFKVRDNVLCAEVVLRGNADLNTLKNTTLKVTETASEYDYTRTTDYDLSFVSSELKGEGENAYTVAVYKYISDADTVSFGSEQYKKTFEVNPVLTFGEESPLKEIYSNEIYTPQILNRSSVSVSKLSAESAWINLIENGTDGYKLGVDISFDREIKAVVTNEVYLIADMTVNDESVPMYLTLESAENNTLSFVCDTPFSLRSGDITTFTLRNRFTSPAAFVTDAEGMPVCELIEGVAQFVADTSRRGIASDSQLTLSSAGKDSFTAEAMVVFGEAINENSFENSKINSKQIIYYSDGSKTVTEAVLKFSKLPYENSALFKAELSVPKDAVATEVVLGDEILPASGSCIYTLNRTVILSTAVPESEDLELTKDCAKKTTFFITNGNEKIESLNDVELHIVYPKEIVAESLEGISLKVAVRGIKGITDAEFKAIKVKNGNTLVFAPAQNVDGEYASVLTLALKDSVISVSEKSALYSSESGISLSTAVIDAEVSLLTVYDDVVVPPVETTPDATEKVTEAPSEEPTGNTQTKPDKTEPVRETEDKTENTSESQNGDFLTTGANFRYIIIASVVLMLVSIAVVLLLRKKKA